MSQYIDGYAFPIARERIDEYVPVAAAVAEIYLEHGAIDYREFIGDDLDRHGTRPFPDAVNASVDETVVFGWIIYDSRETRDLVNQRVESDPRMEGLVASLLDPANPVFDPMRMAYGGFQSLIQAAANTESPG
jgi:uncharacterized protein YbaA (DUF1428 family)